MGAKKKAAAAAGAAKAAKDSPYVKRLVEDEDLRDNIAEAYESVRDAYARLSNGKSPTKAIFDDKKLQKDLKQAAESIRQATVALREAPKKQRSGGFMRKLMLVSIAAGLALALSEDLRKKVLDALFGAEEEFEYTSTTTPSGSGATGGTTTPSTPAGSTS
jgi:hypothetical protein